MLSLASSTTLTCIKYSRIWNKQKSLRLHKNPYLPLVFTLKFRNEVNYYGLFNEKLNYQE